MMVELCFIRLLVIVSKILVCSFDELYDPNLGVL